MAVSIALHTRFANWESREIGSIVDATSRMLLSVVAYASGPVTT